MKKNVEGEKTSHLLALGSKASDKVVILNLSSISFEFQSSNHWIPAPNSLFLVNTGNGVGWRRSTSWILQPASTSSVMLKKAVTLALAQLLYSRSLRQPMLAESVSGDTSKLYGCGKTVTERTWLQGNECSCSITNTLNS